MKVVLKSGTTSGFEDYIAKIPAGGVIFDEGEVGTEMFVIQSGSVEIVKRVGEGEKHLATLEKGDFFGEMSILEEIPRTAVARAKTDCELVKINQSTFDEMLRHNGEVAVRMLRKLSRRLRETTKLLEASTGIPQSLEESSDIFTKVGERHEIYRFIVDTTNEEFYLNREGETTIGRIDPVTGIRPDVDLTNLDTQRSVSRRHAKIVFTGGEFKIVEEIGTMNGTFVNGRRIPTGSPISIKDGDKIRSGLVDMTFRVTQE
ncbi:MAG: cyclic nucleotide-binding domain-containing protein [Thermoanaerobaculia bacterium]